MWVEGVTDVDAAARFERSACTPSGIVQYMESAHARAWTDELDIRPSNFRIDVRPALPLVQAPTLVVHGTHDQIIPFFFAELFTDQIPDAELVAVDMGHGSFEPGGDEVAATSIETWLTGHAAQEFVPVERVLSTVCSRTSSNPRAETAGSPAIARRDFSSWAPDVPVASRASHGRIPRADHRLSDEADEVDLRLRPLRVEDEAAYRAAHGELLADGFSFGFIQEGESFADYVQRLERQRRGHDLGDFVEGTWLIAEVAEQVVGRASIRHQLNDYLAFHGGHIGYGVRPAFRRRGCATEILRQSLIIARSYGIGPVLITCDDQNIASAAVIEACGGQLERVVPSHESDNGMPFRRYWIP